MQAGHLQPILGVPMASPVPRSVTFCSCRNAPLVIGDPAPELIYGNIQIFLV